MIVPDDLRNGIIVHARKPKGNMHREFSLWKVNDKWQRIRSSDHSRIGIPLHIDVILNYLNKYDFEIVGEWEVRYHQKSILRDKFNLNGAL